MAFDQRDLKLEDTELRLGLPAASNDELEKQTTPSSVIIRSNKRALMADMNEESQSNVSSAHVQKCDEQDKTAPPTKAQVAGWPPIRSYRKNCFQAKKTEAEATTTGIYVKVSMDGAPYLRKIDLKVYKNYPELLKGLEDMFKFKVGEYYEREGYNGEYEPTYEDKDGDWMLVGDVPWDMFINSCKRLRIMKGWEARGLSCVM